MGDDEALAMADTEAKSSLPTLRPHSGTATTRSAGSLPVVTCHHFSENELDSESDDKVVLFFAFGAVRLSLTRGSNVQFDVIDSSGRSVCLSAGPAAHRYGLHRCVAGDREGLSSDQRTI